MSTVSCAARAHGAVEDIDMVRAEAGLMADQIRDGVYSADESVLATLEAVSRDLRRATECMTSTNWREHMARAEMCARAEGRTGLAIEIQCFLINHKEGK